MVVMEEQPITGSIKNLGDIRIINVSNSGDEKLWDEMIRKYHYLGLGKIIGPRIKYLVLHNKKAIAAIGFNRASKSIGVRERYIGWDMRQRLMQLKHIVNNMRFLILPWVKVKYLASRILSKCIKAMRKDWQERYGEKPYAVETFVDGRKYKGTCYLAANWLYLGETRGFGKVGNKFVYHGHKKKVFIRIIDRRFVERLRNERKKTEQQIKGPNSSYSRPPLQIIRIRREHAMMIGGTTDWSPKLLEEAGITESGVSRLGAKLLQLIRDFAPCFARGGGRSNFLLYLKGLLSAIERKSIEPIVLHYAGPEKVRSMQTFMGAEKAVDDKALKEQYQERLASNISEDDGMFNVDGSDFPKKGKKSVGVARQHCGNLGKVENCQAGVFLGYSSRKGYGLVDCRLYMPESWMGDDAEERRKECHVPDDITFKTKVELASEMIADAANAGIFKAKWIGADSAFGRNKQFLDSLPEGMLYFADIVFNMTVFPLGDIAERLGPGPVTALDIAADEGALWTRTILAEGAKGPIIADEKIFRVKENRDGKPGEEVWLYLRRYSDGKLKCALCNAPADMPKDELHRVATMRWPIEQCFEECKRELGMDHYEGRSWLLWHRHMLFVFIAYLFLLEVRLGFKKKTNIDTAASSRACYFGDGKEYSSGTCCDTTG